MCQTFDPPDLPARASEIQHTEDVTCEGEEEEAFLAGSEFCLLIGNVRRLRFTFELLGYITSTSYHLWDKQNSSVVFTLRSVISLAKCYKKLVIQKGFKPFSMGHAVEGGLVKKRKP